MINHAVLQQALEEARALGNRPAAGILPCAAGRYANILHPHTPSMGNPYPPESIRAEREALAFLLAQKPQQVVKALPVRPPKKVKAQPQVKCLQPGLFEVMA